MAAPRAAERPAARGVAAAHEDEERQAQDGRQACQGRHAEDEAGHELAPVEGQAPDGGLHPLPVLAVDRQR